MKTYEELNDVQKELYNFFTKPADFVLSDCLWRHEVMEVFELIAADYVEDTE